MGSLNDAKETFGWAARSMAVPFGRLPEARRDRARRRNDPDRAVEYARKSIEVNAYNSGAFEILAAAHRKAGRPAEATGVLAWLLEFDPLDHFARFELYLLDQKPEDLEEFKSLIRNELPHETYIEMALTYIRPTSCDDDAGLFSNRRPAASDRVRHARLLHPRQLAREERRCLDKVVDRSRPASSSPSARRRSPSL